MKKIALLPFLALSLFIPVFALADHSPAHTIEQLIEQIKILSLQIEYFQKSQSSSLSSVRQEVSKPLSIGSRGEEVKRVQSILARDSSLYPEKLVTGYFGTLTRSAVLRFQNKAGIFPTGIVDQETAKQIEAQSGVPNLAQNTVTDTSRDSGISFPGAIGTAISPVADPQASPQTPAAITSYRPNFGLKQAPSPVPTSMSPPPPPSPPFALSPVPPQTLPQSVPVVVPPSPSPVPLPSPTPPPPLPSPAIVLPQAHILVKTDPLITGVRSLYSPSVITWRERRFYC